MEFKSSLEAKYFLNLQKVGFLKKRTLLLLILFLERYFGASILLEMPSKLQDIDPEIYPAINLAHKMKGLGIIPSIKKSPKLPDEPFIHEFIFASPHVSSSAGADFLSEKRAIWKFLGESTERFLWKTSDAFYLNKTKSSSFRDLPGEALDIFSLSGFSGSQKKNFEILHFDERTRFDWIKAHSLTSKKKLYCPVQLVSSKYHQEKVKSLKNTRKEEPMLQWNISTGLATGRCLSEATVKGMLEIIERDAFMITYLNKLSAPTVSLSHLAKSDVDIARVLHNFQRYNLEVCIVKLPTDMPVCVYLATITDRSGLGPALTVGASADFDAKKCILDALSEAHCTRLFAKKHFFKEIDPEKLNFKGRVLYWAKKENLPKISFLTEGKKIIIDVDKKRNFYDTLENNSRILDRYYRKKLYFLTSELKKKKYEAYFVELSSKKAKKLGFRCVKTVLPQFQPLHLDERIPYFGGKRLQEIPLELGYEPTKEINRERHPFP
ncbi:MAG: YcaO-like family protein [Candidatus Moraniibacteriota bacterium]